jgi:hypothetical protein
MTVKFFSFNEFADNFFIFQITEDTLGNLCHTGPILFHFAHFHYLHILTVIVPLVRMPTIAIGRLLAGLTIPLE